MGRVAIKFPLLVIPLWNQESALNHGFLQDSRALDVRIAIRFGMKKGISQNPEVHSERLNFVYH